MKELNILDIITLQPKQNVDIVSSANTLVLQDKGIGNKANWEVSEPRIEYDEILDENYAKEVAASEALEYILTESNLTIKKIVEYVRNIPLDNKEAVVEQYFEYEGIKYPLNEHQCKDIYAIISDMPNEKVLTKMLEKKGLKGILDSRLNKLNISHSMLNAIPRDIVLKLIRRLFALEMEYKLLKKEEYTHAFLLSGFSKKLGRLLLSAFMQVNCLYKSTHEEVVANSKNIASVVEHKCLPIEDIRRLCTLVSNSKVSYNEYKDLLTFEIQNDAERDLIVNYLCRYLLLKHMKETSEDNIANVEKLNVEIDIACTKRGLLIVENLKDRDLVTLVYKFHPGTMEISFISNYHME